MPEVKRQDSLAERTGSHTAPGPHERRFHQSLHRIHAPQPGDDGEHHRGEDRPVCLLSGEAGPPTPPRPPIPSVPPIPSRDPAPRGGEGGASPPGKRPAVP